MSCAHTVWKILTGPIDDVRGPGVKLETMPESAQARHEYKVSSADGTWTIFGYTDGLAIRCVNEEAYVQVQNGLEELGVEYRGVTKLFIPFHSERNQRIARQGR